VRARHRPAARTCDLDAPASAAARFRLRWQTMKLSHLVIALALMACGGKKDADKTGGGSGTQRTGAGTAKPAAKELADAAEPAGITWQRAAQPFGSVELPTGPTWNITDGQLEGKDGTVVMMQAQVGITPDQLDEYLASYEDVQKRDAPKYAGKPSTKGTVGGAPAVRVEGTFDNGTKFVTRDYLIFTDGKVVALSGRTPEANAAMLPGVIDHIARSLQAK
jgi:hypothetical protein